MNKDTLARVVDCIAKTTRYPTTLLLDTADLEYDLGIDSVKRLEIVVALEEEFGLPLAGEPYDSSIRTIGDIAAWVDGFANARDAHSGTPQNLRREIPPTGSNGHSYLIDASTSQQPAPPHFLTENPASAVMAAGKPLSGRVAFVTGSGRGVGRTIARVLATRGATVIVNSFHSREQGEETTAEINSQGGSAVHLWGSVANPSQVDQMFAEIKRKFGPSRYSCLQRFGRSDRTVHGVNGGRLGSSVPHKCDGTPSLCRPCRGTHAGQRRWFNHHDVRGRRERFH